MKKALHWLDENFELAISSVFLVGMIIAVTMQVISRYLFPSPISWTEEATRYLFVWLTFTSLGICCKRGKHIRITLLQSKHPKLTPYLGIFSDLVFGFVAVMCGIYGIQIVKTIREAGQMSSALPIYKWQVYLIVPIGFALTIIRLVQDIVLNVRHIANKTEFAKKEEEEEQK